VTASQLPHQRCRLQQLAVGRFAAEGMGEAYTPLS